MDRGYVLALASQPVGQVLLQQADRACSALQRSLEAPDPAAVVHPPDTKEDEPLPRWPLSSATALLNKASLAGSNLYSRLLKSVNPRTTSEMANFFKKKRENIVTLKLKGLELMEREPKVKNEEKSVSRAFLWPISQALDYVNSIARPYVSPAEEVKERDAVKVAMRRLQAMVEEEQLGLGGSADDSAASWQTSLEELCDAEQPPSCEGARPEAALLAAERATAETERSDTPAATSHGGDSDMSHRGSSVSQSILTS
ncbi:uncharacterized protein LOC134534709 [Bacillus rossius redtenbacheri]|uniref:uncharacterized protein LOC134534709 n=1 Tax=Bacillus rossius redtenbacheri TaxID=93214 RepID=UPI002FDE997A